MPNKLTYPNTNAKSVLCHSFPVLRLVDILVASYLGTYLSQLLSFSLCQPSHLFLSVLRLLFLILY